MTTDTTLARSSGTDLAPLAFDEDQRRMIRDSFANGASDAEFAMLLEVAKARRLNPLLRQIHFVKRWDSQKRCEVWSVQAAIDGLRAIAERTGLYAGQDEPEFEETDGAIKLCRVRVWRKDWPRPAVGVAYWSEYVQTIRDKVSGKERPSAMWARMPHVMLAKCAESLALRKAFPEDMGGLYSDEEMGQADNGRLDAGAAITPATLRAVVGVQSQRFEDDQLCGGGPRATLPAATPDVDPEASRAYAAYVTAVEAAKTCESVAVAYNALPPALRLENRDPAGWTKDALAVALRRVADLGVVASRQALTLCATDMGDLPGVVDDLLTQPPAALPAWLVARQPVIATLPAPGPDVVRMVAARRHAGVVTLDQPSTSAATRALDEALAALTGREPGSDDGDEPALDPGQSDGGHGDGGAWHEKPPSREAFPAIDAFYARLDEVELPGEAVVVWMRFRAALAPLDASVREGAWKALCARAAEVGKMKNAAVWLKKAIAEEDSQRAENSATLAARALSGQPDPDEPPPSAPTPPTKGRRTTAAVQATPIEAAVSAAFGPAAWLRDDDAALAHATSWSHARHVESSVRLHGYGLTGPAAERLVRVAVARLEALASPDEHGTRLTAEGLRQTVARWATQGPVTRAKAA